MAKPIKTILKLQIPAGAANPAPPVGPALGQHGINIAQFCQQFNEATKKWPAILFRRKLRFTKTGLLNLN